MYMYNVYCTATRSDLCCAYDNNYNSKLYKSFRMLSMDTGRSEMDRGKFKTASPRAIQDKTLSE